MLAVGLNSLPLLFSARVKTVKQPVILGADDRFYSFQRAPLLIDSI